MPAPFEPFLLNAGPGRSGQRLCIHHPPHGGSSRGAVVYVHPFAEEMNKSRRMAALTSRALAAQGFAVLQIDLLGCGDSSGDSGDASWGDWIDDVLLASRWMQHHHDAPLWLWGLRAGALLAGAAASHLATPPGLLLWQPATQGKALLKQFLRLKMAASLASGGGRGVVDELRKALAAGHSVEVAGYRLAPGLSSGMEAATLHPGPGTPGIIWLEAASRTEAELLPVSRTTIDGWRASGLAVTVQTVSGPPFWQTTEIEEAPALVAATVAAMLGARGVGSAATLVAA